MRIGGIQKCSLIDFPGKIAAVLFTRGCNFRCPYCHNAQLLKPVPPMNDADIPAIFDFLKSRTGRLDGVVISGGEPTLQPGLACFMKDLKNMGYAVKLDTNGTRPEILRYIIEHRLADFIAMDIKASFENYDAAAGVPVDIELIRDSIDLIKESGIEYEFRTTLAAPVVSQKDVLKIAAMLEDVSAYRVQQFSFSPAVPDRRLGDYAQLSTAEVSALQEEADLRLAAAFEIAA